MRIAVILTLSIVSLISCQFEKPAAKRRNEIRKFAFATGGCFGHCPFLAIEMDSTLKCKYYGGEYAKKQGYYTGTITQTFWDSLNMRLEEIRYQQMDSSYQHTVDDLSTEMIIYYGNQKKTVHAQLEDVPDSVKAVYLWLLQSANRIDLQPNQDSLTFATRIQTHIVPTIKFLPPLTKR